MKKRIFLFNHFTEYENVPDWWKNFIYDNSLYNHSAVNKVLKHSHGKLIWPEDFYKESAFVDFDTEEDAIAFILRWS